MVEKFSARAATRDRRCWSKLKHHLFDIIDKRNYHQMRRTAVPGRIKVRRSKNCHSLRRQYSPHMEYKPGPARRLKTHSMSCLAAHKQYCRRIVGTVRDNSVVCKKLAL